MSQEVEQQSNDHLGTTKRHVVLIYKPWRLMWWYTISSIIGSLFYIAGSAAGLTGPVQQSNTLDMVAVGYTFICGRVFYCISASIQLYNVLQMPTTISNKNDQQTIGNQNNKHRQHTAPHNVAEHSHESDPAVVAPYQPDIPIQIRERSDDGPAHAAHHRKRWMLKLCMWNRVDYLTAVNLWIGSLFFLCGVIAGCGAWPEMTKRHGLLPELFSIYPNILGSVFFTISSYFQLVQITHSWMPFQPIRLEYWSGVCFLVGSLGFLVSSSMYFWFPGRFGSIPLFLGAVFYFTAAVIQYAEHSDKVASENV